MIISSYIIYNYIIYILVGWWLLLIVGIDWVYNYHNGVLLRYEEPELTWMCCWGYFDGYNYGHTPSFFKWNFGLGVVFGRIWSPSCEHVNIACSYTHMCVYIYAWYHHMYVCVNHRPCMYIISHLVLIWWMRRYVYIIQNIKDATYNIHQYSTIIYRVCFKVFDRIPQIS